PEARRDAPAPTPNIQPTYSITVAHPCAAMGHKYRRDVQRTRAAADAAIALAAEHELVAWLAWATVLRGWASVEQGQIDEGIAQIRQGIAGWRTGGAGCLQSYFLSLLADVRAHACAMDDGLATVAEALAMVAETGEGVAEAELHRIKG